MPDMKSSDIVRGSPKVNNSMKRVIDCNQPGRHMKEIMKGASPQKKRKK